MNDNALGFAAGAPPGGPPGDAVVERRMSRLLRGSGRVVRALLDDVVTTVVPCDCRTCGGALLKADLFPICDECVESVPPQASTLCGRCGEALDMEGVRYAGQFPVEGLLCSPCRMAPPEFERAVAYAVYQDELREMVHLLKYERVSAIAPPLGRMLAKAVEVLEGEAGRDLLVVGVPLFPAKERQRGYNQAVLIADAMLAELHKAKRQWKMRAAHGVIRRVRDTQSQFGLTARGRRLNLRGAFEVVDRSLLSGREVLLVDDIYTTGATARACSQVLRRAGVSKVWVATVSRAQPEMVASWDGGSEAEVWDVGSYLD